MSSMNREIKFRAWDKDRRKIVKWEELAERVTMGGPIGQLFSGKAEVPMQFTGLLDKNRKEVYEGDIIAFEQFLPENTVIIPNPHDPKAHVPLDTPLKNKKCMGHIEWVGTGYYVKISLPRKGGQPISMLMSHKTQVIGNIYENPELLTSNPH